MNEHLSYDFLSPQRIVFGWGRRREVGVLGRTLGQRAFLICGLPPEVAKATIDEIAGLLRAEGVEPVPLATLLHEPEVGDVDRVAADIRGYHPREGDFLLAVGGGAAIDLAKATAAMATNGDSPTVKDYLEGVGRGLRLSQKPLPVLAMPSTAGTGAEATKNAVISSYDPPFKKSLRDDRLVPRIALLDPQLTVTVPPSVTAASGMDAITQLIESYVSRKSQPIPRALAAQGLKMAAPAIVEAVANGSSQPAREAMAHAALLSGMALANSGLGMAHGVAAALGTHCRVPHGVACALMLPAAIRANREAAQADFARLAHLLIGRTFQNSAEAANAFEEEIEGLCDRVGVPRRLGPLGVTREQIPSLVKSSRGASMSGNPREISDAELTVILEGLL
jgi:alcohol dehydrogenase class IV